jgi:hypothetical protein
MVEKSSPLARLLADAGVSEAPLRKQLSKFEVATAFSPRTPKNSARRCKSTRSI